MSPEATDFDDKGVSKDDIGADEYSRMSDNLNLPSKNTKLSNSEKWDDSKPGGGNTKDLEKLKKESKDMRKNDNKMLEEAYNNIVVQEAGGWVDRLTSRVGGAVAGAKELIGGGTRGAADAYKLRSQVDYVKKTFEGLKQGMQKMGINPQSLQNIDHMMNQMSSQIEAEILQSGQVAQHAQGQQQRAAQAGQAQATAAGQLAQGAQAAQAGGLAQAWHAQDAVSAQQRAQTANQRWDNAPITQAGQQGNAANPQLASASPSNVQAPTSGPVPQQAQAPGFYQPK
jgi:hypothetical protein